MFKRISLLVAAALLVATMAMAGLAAPAFAKVGCTTDKVKGTTYTTCTQGSHGSTSEHQGAPNSSGTSKNPPTTCKNTGSQQTNTC